MTAFVDTNVLVYAEDLDAGRKHEVAVDLIRRLWDSAEGVLSAQVLQEYYVITTRKVARPVPLDVACRAVEEYLTWRVVAMTPELLLGGMRRSQDSQMSLWDALIVEAALSQGCDVLYTEDLQHGRMFGRMRVVNPFR